MHGSLRPSCASLYFKQRLHPGEFTARAVEPGAYVSFIGLRDFVYAILSMIPAEALLRFNFRHSLHLLLQPLVELLSNSSTGRVFFPSQSVAQLNINYGISSSSRCLLVAGLSSVYAAFWLPSCSRILFHNLASKQADRSEYS